MAQHVHGHKIRHGVLGAMEVVANGHKCLEGNSDSGATEESWGLQGMSEGCGLYPRRHGEVQGF